MVHHKSDFMQINFSNLFQDSWRDSALQNTVLESGGGADELHNKCSVESTEAIEELAIEINLQMKEFALR